MYETFNVSLEYDNGRAKTHRTLQRSSVPRNKAQGLQHCKVLTVFQTKFLPRYESLLYHTRTIWLFTHSDVKTIIFPSTLFAVICVLSGVVFENDMTLTAITLTRRAIFTALWVWMNLLPFAIENQRQPDSVVEDLKNKPWRPLPASRITSRRAALLMLVFYFLASLSSILLGGLLQCLSLICLGFWYNNLRGADSSYIIRQFINACGYVCFTSGAVEVISGCSIASFRLTAHQWFAIIGAVIFTTIQSQDMPDQVGDSIRNRRTAPLVIGDWAARVTIAITVGFWSLFCPAFWQTQTVGFAATICLGMIVTARFLLKRTVEADKTSFRVYNLWIVSLFLLPLFKNWNAALANSI